MNIDTVFVTRYVASHADSLPWYEKLFGRPSDRRPMPSCHEWTFGDSVIFQVIEFDARQGETSVAFLTPDLEAETRRLRDSGLDVDDPTPVEGFTTLRYTELLDPDHVALGLLAGE